MSTQIYEKNRITITRYGRGEGKGYGFQVTWPSTHSVGDFCYISFEQEDTARKFVEILELGMGVDK